MKVLVLVDDQQDVSFFDDIDLVDQQKDRRLDILEGVEDEFVAVAEFLGGVDEQADEVGRLERRVDEIHHPFVQLVERLVDARVIDENDLAFVGRVDAQDADPRRLRLVGDDGDFLAEQAVEQGGFSDVRPADEGDIADP